MAFALRFDDKGVLNPAFGASGAVAIDPGRPGAFTAATSVNRETLAVGQKGGATFAALFGNNLAGPTFQAALSFGAATASVEAVVADRSPGRAVVVGTTGTGADTRVGVARVLLDGGGSDPSFTAIVPKIGDAGSRAGGVAGDEFGQIVVAGSADIGPSGTAAGVLFARFFP